MNGKKILFATDFSEASQHALQYASWLAACTKAKLYIVHVSQRETAPVGELFDEEPAPDTQELDRLRSVRPGDANIECEHRVLTGETGSVETVDPAAKIVEFANREHVDMIVLGTHGRSGFGHLLMGSVAESVVRHAHCPVVTVRQGKSS
jgi:nucleotide-binding universal stress UspA family protein